MKQPMINSSQLLIRTATDEDRNAVYKMICGLENTTIDRQGFDFVFDKNLKSNNIRYFLAFLDNNPVGMVSCHIQPLLHHAALVSEIQEMYVEPEYRSLQIGKALVERVVNFARKQGAIQMEVTSRNIREQAHRFYQREGFEKSHVKLVRYFKDEA
ncbi:GNAT family N-acetyltransferase [Dyadobacter sp. Leaf189]|uniref:GNAT family N-acetyltransferase n=1 Tax=Dyadobacter sp. Leaf189 TaxID=1736295 RepID=UPI000701EF7F|nr:GNAT family N-acetyltransferase [Dyadobacter sp. Leaf189]KQS34079.1 GCN5 family acetyltransferase [Dyadobacter sp. Leaf189]